MKNKEDHKPIQGAVRNKVAEKIKWRTRCNDINKGDSILLPGSTEIDEEDGKSKRKNIYTKDSGGTWTEREKWHQNVGKKFPSETKPTFPLQLETMDLAFSLFLIALF